MEIKYKRIVAVALLTIWIICAILMGALSLLEKVNVQIMHIKGMTVERKIPSVMLLLIVLFFLPVGCAIVICAQNAKMQKLFQIMKYVVLFLSIVLIFGIASSLGEG